MLRFSARGHYAVSAVLDLALHHGEGRIAIQEIARRRRIPQRYLEQVLLALKRAGLLESRRGAAGGYHLSRPPETITVGDVLRAVEGGVGPGGAGGDLGGLWADVGEAVANVVDVRTFGELAGQARERERAGRAMYHI